MFASGTHEALPAAVKVDELFDGVRYRLPDRELGALRFLGLLPIAFGFGVAAFALSFAATAAGLPFEKNGDFNWFFLFFLAFTIPFVYAALKTIKIGLLVFGGHSEIELRAGELRAIERFGPLRWVRKRPLESVATFRVTSAPDTSASHSRLAGIFTGLAGIVVECDSAKQMAMAVAYPQQWLVPLANELAQRWDLATPDTLTGASRPSVEVTQGSLESSREAGVVDQTDVVEPLASSKIGIDAHADGVTLTVPPAGLFKGSKGLFVFSLVWCAATGGISTALFFGGPETWLFVGLFLLVFWLVGIAALLSAINMGRRRAVLAIVGDRLMVLQTGLFGSKRREWSRDEVESIGIGPSGLRVNDRPVLELQVHPKQGSKFGVLSGRDHGELRWMATVLRRGLSLRANALEAESSEFALDNRASE